MQIHFICYGNAYRSRMAEAYLKSKQLTNLKVISSGLSADSTYIINGPISWYAMRIIKNNKLIPFMTPMSQTTTEDMLEKASLNIFLHPQNYQLAQQKLNYIQVNYEIWDIKDIDDYPYAQEIYADDLKAISISEQTYQQIKKNIDDLLHRLALT